MEGVITKHVVYIDPSVIIFSEKHNYMILLSVFVTVFIYFPPVLLLVIYPTSLYRKISDRMSSRWRIGIKIFVEMFHGCYKDGTNGTRDYRSYSLLLPGFVLLPIQGIMTKFLGTSFSIDNNIPQYVNVVFVCLLIILISMIQPYNQKIENISAVTMLTLLAGNFVLSTGLHAQKESDLIRIMIVIFTLIPHCALGIYVMWRMKNILPLFYQRYKNSSDEETHVQLFVERAINA